MKIEERVLSVATSGQGFVDITGEINRLVAASGIARGICHVFIQHTSASLLISENADPAVLRDLERFMARTAPENFGWEHDDEGPDDMPAHVRAALTRTSETVPIQDAKLALGTWQAIYVFEHRRRPHERRVLLTLMGQ